MNALKLARQMDGLKQLELERKTGINHAWISLIENGWREPTEAQIKKIRRVLPSFDRAVEILKEGSDQ